MHRCLRALFFCPCANLFSVLGKPFFMPRKAGCANLFSLRAQTGCHNTMWLHRFDFPLFFYYHVPKESHPSEGAVFIASEVLTKVLKRYSYQKADDPISLKIVSSEKNIPAFYWPDGNPHFDKEQPMLFRGVIQNDKFVETSVNSGSPFLFTSNSFFDWPDRGVGANFLTYSSYYLQSIPDWLYQSGVSFGPMLKNLITNPNLLSGRKAIIINMVGGPTLVDQFPSIPNYLLGGANKISLEKTIDSLVPSSSITEVQSESNVIIKKTDDEETSIQSGSSEVIEFTFSLLIPSVPEKTNCMLRLNFTKTSAGTFKITDSDDNSILDLGQITKGKYQFVDFFIKTSTESISRKIDVNCKFKTQDEILFRNIELWYY